MAKTLAEYIKDKEEAATNMEELAAAKTDAIELMLNDLAEAIETLEAFHE